MILLFIFIISLLLIAWYRKDNKLPPGPFSLPIVGYYPFVTSEPLAKIQKISENYGPIMRLNLLGEDFYFLNSFEAVNEALKIQGDNFSGRASMEFSLMNEIHGTKGFANLERKQYKTEKLSGLGIGKSDFALRVHELCDDLIGYIKEQEEITELSMYLSNFTSNVISLLLINKKYAPNDPVYIQLMKESEKLVTCGPDLYFYISGPITYLLLRANQKLWNTFHYQRRQDTDATSSTLHFGCYLMANNPNIQQKVYQEIIDIFGNNYRVLPTNIEKLHYTRAVLVEIQRFSCVVPFGLIHTNRKPTTICGYHLPKSSKIIANILKLSRDNRYFKNPNAFDPNNFLDDYGNYVPNEALIPFGIGEGKCLGKKLAEMELIIGFTRLIQQFEWLSPKDEVMKFDVNERLVRYLSPFKIIAKSRI